MTATRVLVVEDNDRNLKLVRDVLVHAGFVVVEARSGEQGVTLAREAPPDLVLMDLGLPGMDGTEALRLLRGSPDTAGIPVVAVTAYAMPTDEERSRAAGFDGYLTKPLDVLALPGQVRGYLTVERQS
jgi:two-component system, cell cycle response regulator DivK